MFLHLKYVQGGVTKYRTLMLRPRAATIYNNNDFRLRIESDRLGSTWLETSSTSTRNI